MIRFQRTLNWLLEKLGFREKKCQGSKTHTDKIKRFERNEEITLKVIEDERKVLKDGDEREETTIGLRQLRKRNSRDQVEKKRH